jgi:hypothetical protein
MNWSYIAGYFDGEGHVGLHTQTGRRGKVTTLNWYNSHRESLQAMRDFIGTGYIGFGNGKGYGGFDGSKKVVYVLRISRKMHIIRAIDAMLPDLLVKREEALLLRQHLIDHVNEKRAENFGKLLAIPITDYQRWYFEEGKSYADIATMLNATTGGIARIFRIHNLPARPAGGAHLRGIAKSKETKARMKASRAKMWQDPEFRAAQIAAMQEGKRAGGFHQASGYTKPAIQGEKHPRSKLTDAQTAEIYTRYQAGQASLQGLATEHGVSKKTILNIVHGKIRTHVTAALAPASSLEDRAVTDERC